ncbi:MAG: DUF2848 domain-containing protein [Desulfobacterota bacterium]|nr:DUF2848 domain-containing protein [Thermodesulfobacteriota bacterium]
MKTLRFILETMGKEEEILFTVRRMINAGYTGRDQEKVRHHIEELKKEGVPAPDSTPTAYEMITQLVTFDEEIEVVSERTSGEAEYVLLCSGEEIYVGVGSDHTDRELEAVSILKSKQICPNVMSDRLWRFSEVEADWDGMVLRSWTEDETGKRVLYQEATLSAILSPGDLIDFVKKKAKEERLDGTMIFSGTIPLLTGTFLYGPSFEAELFNPRTGKRLGCHYRVRVLDYLRR